MWGEIRRRPELRRMREMNAPSATTLPGPETSDWKDGVPSDVADHPAVTAALEAFPEATASHRQLEKPTDGLETIEEDAA